MKKYLLLLIPFLFTITAYSQNGYSSVFLRVTDSATFVNSANTTAKHAANYADIWYSVNSGLFWEWNAATSTYVIMGSRSGGATAAGATGNIQYKSLGGGLQAEAAFSYDSATNIVDADIITVNDDAYAVGWNGSLQVPTKNAVYDKIESLSGANIINTPAGNIAATNVQAAINELDTEKLAATATTLGAQDLFISSAAMWPRTTGGCAALSKTEMATSLFNVQTLDFDQTTQEFAQFQVSLPRNWNNGTITVTVYWTAAAGTGTVQWDVNGGAYSNDDALTVAFGTIVEIDDTLLATNDLHISPTSTAITLAGTPADSDFLALQISRDPSEDTLTGDAKLLGVRVTITLDAGTSE